MSHAMRRAQLMAVTKTSLLFHIASSFLHFKKRDTYPYFVLVRGGNFDECKMNFLQKILKKSKGSVPKSMIMEELKA